MTASRLRAVAADMRAKASWDLEPSPWEAGEHIVTAANGTAVVDDGPDGLGGCLGPDHAAYIAAMHPDVALAMADLLDIVEAGYAEYEPDEPHPTQMQIVSAWADNLCDAYEGSVDMRAKGES